MDDTAAAARAAQLAEAARKTLKALAERRRIPTPESFAEVYHELNGGAAPGSPLAVLREVARDLVRSNRISKTELAPLVERARRGDWGGVQATLETVLARDAGGAAGGWPQATLALLKGLDVPHANWTRARKLEAVGHVIEAAASAPDVALERLRKLIDSWGTPPGGAAPARLEPLAGAEETVSGLTTRPGDRSTRPVFDLPPAPSAGSAPAARPGPLTDFGDWSFGATTRPGDRSTRPVFDLPRPASAPSRPSAESASTVANHSAVEAGPAAAEAPAAPPTVAAVEAPDHWQQIALRAVGLLEHACGARGPAAERLRGFVQAAQNGGEAGRLRAQFEDVAAAVDGQVEDEQRIRDGLQRLLGLLCDNMRSLTPDEVWLAGQLEPIRTLLSGPLTAAQLSDAERKLISVMQRQAAARRSLSDAKLALKEMLSTLVARIAAMGDSTGRFYEQIGGYQKQMEDATDFASLSRVVGGLLADTESMRSNLRASQQELEEARRKVENYEVRLRDLERELAQVSSLVQKDPLTQVLNRRGLEDAFRVETARAGRFGTPLSALLIDLDNFKRLNDSLGHLAGDRALVHAVQTIRASLRPSDLLARIGGEEFCVLLPATVLDDSLIAAERCLHMLAANPFRFGEDSCVLTFSGGAAGWRSGESLDELLKRADEVMYAAKRAGKNRIYKAS